MAPDISIIFFVPLGKLRILLVVNKPKAIAATAANNTICRYCI
jgi:hypothetical protein